MELTPLQKAQQKYKDYLRNYLHYDKMVNESVYKSTIKDYETKRNHCNDVMETLTYIFGAEVRGE